MDMQSVCNEQKAIDNKCAYLNKSKGSCSNAMKQTLKTATENKCRNINKRQSELMFILPIESVSCWEQYLSAYLIRRMAAV